MQGYFWETLEDYASNPAIITDDGTVYSYGDLCAAADAFSGEHLAGYQYRPLVLLESDNSFPTIAAYLAALRAGFPVILLARGMLDEDPRIVETYQPNLIVRSGVGDVTVTRTDAPPVEMHPELAVLLSTSGTTGAPKLVRLSRENIQSNAASIAEYLGLDSTERAITTLSFHYSYGMSVLHTHLLVGAALVLTDASVIEDGFWKCVSRNAVTSLALVPFQFELLERSGFQVRKLETLRYITQAGGKLAEPVVRRFAELGKRQGWRLFVMYGQTEAAPRMAYLPPEDLEEWAFSIGRPIPGGKFYLIAEDGTHIDTPNRAGELIYEGPNVMLGYADDRQDLAAPAGPPELHTGDLAEMLENGYYRIVGRLKRFIKLFGLRVSLDEAEDFLRREGITAWCAGKDEHLVVFLTETERAEHAKELLIERYRLTPSVVSVKVIEAPPLLSSGKIDYGTLSAVAGTVEPKKPSEMSGVANSIRKAMRVAQIDMDKSFLEHGSDSLGYVEVQIILSEFLGTPPENWEEMPLRDLIALCDRNADAASNGDALRMQPTPISLSLRIVAIFSVIMLHTTSVPIAGGGYLLVMLVGVSLGRFQFEHLKQGKVGAVLFTQLTDIVAWYYFIIIGVSILFTPVNLDWFLLLGNFDPDVRPRGMTPYWFVCLYVQAVAFVCLFFALPAMRRSISEYPLHAGLFGLALLFGAAFLIDPTSSASGGIQIRHPLFAMQLVFIGWSIQHARTRMQKLIVSAVLIAEGLTTWSFGVTVLPFIVGGGLLIIWLPVIYLPRVLYHVVFFLGANTMYFYLMHPIMVHVVETVFELDGFHLFVLTLTFTLPAAVGSKVIGLRGLDVLKRVVLRCETSA